MKNTITREEALVMFQEQVKNAEYIPTQQEIMQLCAQMVTVAAPKMMDVLRISHLDIPFKVQWINQGEWSTARGCMECDVDYAMNSNGDIVTAYVDYQSVIINAYAFMPNMHWPVACTRKEYMSEILFTLAHELRHVWQHEYGYMDKNSLRAIINNEVVDLVEYALQWAELDANKWALWYLTGMKKGATYVPVPGDMECNDYMKRYDEHYFRYIKY